LLIWSDFFLGSIAQPQSQLQQLQQGSQQQQQQQQLVVVVHETKDLNPAGKSIKQEVRTEQRERTPVNGNTDFLGNKTLQKY
jgi:hypothetical protein